MLQSSAETRGSRNRRLRLRVAALVTATAAAAAGTTAVVLRSAEAATVDTAATYVLVARHSGKALDVYNWSTADGGSIVQFARNNLAVQQWRFVDSGGGWYRIRSVHSGKVLDFRGNNADGANLVQWADANSTSQQFRLADSDSGYVRFVNRSSGKALDIWERSTADGARVSQYTDLGGTNQQFQLARLGGTTSSSTGSSSGSVSQPTGYPPPGRVAGDTGTHDPAVTRTPAGGYLLAQTGRGIPLKTSTDRITWRNAGAVFPNGTPWTSSYNGGGDLWAPDITYRNGTYYLYYSASSFGSQNSAIFLATSTSGTSGSWTNRGLIVSTNSSSNHNAIDPNLIVDAQGAWWLSYGSFWSGLKMIRLDPATGMRSTSDTAVRSIASRPSNSGAIEAPFIVRHGTYYYLFASFDLCCRGASSTYRIVVGRSTSVTGPYVDRNGTAMTNGGGTEILAGRGSVHGPGHQAVLADTGGDFLFYHYYTDSGASRLGINPLRWDAAGWPVVYP